MIDDYDLRGSRPEPPPKQGKEDVPEKLIPWLEDHDHNAAANLVRERVNSGVDKYGTRLQTHNGRDPIEDARQEIGDALQYIAQAGMEGMTEDQIVEFYDLLNAAGDLLEYFHFGEEF